MKKTKKSIATDPVLNKSVNKGQVNTQTRRDSLLMHDDNMADQSEGARAEGQPTAMQGRGAGFSRNVH